MIVARPVVGSTIEARCTRCCQNLPHTVISVKENHLHRVQCAQCDWEHSYRPPLSLSTASMESSSGASEWQKLKATFAGRKAIRYSITRNYEVEALIDHPHFGLGLVRRIKGKYMVEVLFESGAKLMRCNGG